MFARFASQQAYLFGSKALTMSFKLKMAQVKFKLGKSKSLSTWTLVSWSEFLDPRRNLLSLNFRVSWFLTKPPCRIIVVEDFDIPFDSDHDVLVGLGLENNVNSFRICPGFEWWEPTPSSWF